MNNANIFRRYKQEENHLTNGLISILRMSRLGGAVLLASFLRDELRLHSGTEVSTFRVLRDFPGTADAELSGDDCYLLVEDKVVSGALRKDQIDDHLACLAGRSERQRKLVLLTPDDSKSAYIQNHLSRDRDRIVHVGWKRVYEFLDRSATGTPSILSDLVRQFCDQIHEMVFKQDMAGVIVKIDFGDKSQVFERQYLDAMRAGSWTQWNTPKQYKSLDGTGRKLLLYDRTRQGVTVEVEIDRVECAEATSAYPWANVFAPATLRVLEPPIPLSVIRRVSGFQHFGLYRKDRSPYRNVTHEQYRELTAERSTEANATEPAAFPLPLAAESVP